MSNTTRSPIRLFVTLSTMMFSLFFVWGAWYATMGSFMVKHDLTDHIAWAYSVAPIVAIITPFFMGVFADRFINSEKLQGMLLFLRAVFIILAPQFATPASAKVYTGLLIAHTLCFMPTVWPSTTLCLKLQAHPYKY